MGAVMKMDVTPYRNFLIMLSIAGIFLLVAIIVGAAGPQVYEKITWSAYQCPGGSRVWSDKCTGVTLRDPNQKWKMDLPPMHLFNKLWIIEMTPYKWQNITDGIEANIRPIVSIYGSNSPPGTSDKQQQIRVDDMHTDILECPQGSNSQCLTFTLVDEQFLTFAYYHVEISISSADVAHAWVGDVDFTLSRYTKGFGDMELSYRTIYLFFNVAILIAFLWRMKSTPFFNGWAFEQKAILVLLSALILYNDPFYGLTFLSKGWFFEFLNSVFETLFISLILLFWLIIIDKIRLDQLRLEPSVTHIVQLLVVGVYSIMTLILFAWARIRASEDPVYSERDGITGMLVLFWFISILYGAIIIWLIVLIVMTVPIVNQKKYLLNRFVFIGIPTILCIFSVIIGIFTGTLGPFNRDSLGLVYFLTLYNVYTYILVAGCWPVDESLLGVTVGAAGGRVNAGGEEGRELMATGVVNPGVSKNREGLEQLQEQL
eukprot:TRINITY_DN792_c0_g1_i1.p1 TRINITY_DN792_c0_g1~~TRINITY_DN792_c0_g1_i1.p1  ORF type:complete len:486 (+),score=82.39 TRINITY_DN792_c0_g1_i1:201-1658(+)